MVWSFVAILLQNRPRQLLFRLEALGVVTGLEVGMVEVGLPDVAATRPPDDRVELLIARESILTSHALKPIGILSIAVLLFELQLFPLRL